MKKNCNTLKVKSSLSFLSELYFFVKLSKNFVEPSKNSSSARALAYSSSCVHESRALAYSSSCVFRHACMHTCACLCKRVFAYIDVYYTLNFNGAANSLLCMREYFKHAQLFVYACIYNAYTIKYICCLALSYIKHIISRKRKIYKM